jgi:ABC-type oligopeptide transport system substrate-binding subunit
MGSSVFCTFNNTLFPFDNQLIRKAFSLSIHREALVEEIDCSFEIAAKRFLPPPLAKGEIKGLISHNEVLAKQCLKQGMAQLGVHFQENLDPFKLRMFFENMTLLHENTPIRRKAALVLQKQWERALGVQVQLDGVSYPTLLQKLYSGSYAMGLGSWFAQFMDPMDILERFSSKNIMKNYPRFENREYADLVHNGASSSNRERRIEALNRAEELLIEETPLTPLYHYHHLLIARPDLKGIIHLPNGALRFTSCPNTPSHELISLCS